jgi:hypothetical protein
MAKYENLSGRSNVKSYKSTRGKLNIKFGDGSRYLYTPGSAGAYKLRRMRELAGKGIGLNRYINKKVKNNYESKST